jgi:signal transduction histidine kinase
MANPPSSPPPGGRPPQLGKDTGSRPTVPAAQVPARNPGAELVSELMQSQRQLTQSLHESRELRTKLARRSHQMSVLQHVSEILAATSKEGQVASVLMDVLTQEFHCHKAVIWTMEDGGGGFVPREGAGLAKPEWSTMRLSAPNPFPDVPVVLFQNQWLDVSHLPASLQPLVDKDTGLYFLPFENQLLLLGFAVMVLPRTHKWEEEDLDSLAILKRQTSVSLYNAWLFRDIAEQRDALQRQALELERVNASVREADQLKSEFLALTSHELRTPLTGILGFTRLVMDGLYESPEEMQQMLGDSYASGQHLLELLNDILDLAKIESGRMEVHCEPFSLSVLIEELKPVAEAYPRKSTVELRWPDNLSEMPEALVDQSRLRQVMLNLLSNALKFTKEGSVSVLVERGVGTITLSVVDTGIGVSPEGQKRLFQKFAQAEGGHAREFGGTGLGLVICKHLMEMMGGSISLFSEGHGQGTTLSVTVKIA